MRSVIFFAALAAAAPLVNQRDVAFSTSTQEVVETLWTTTTLYVDPTPSNSASAAGFFENHSEKPASTSSSSTISTTQPPVSSTPTPSSSSSNPPPPPPPTTSAAPSSSSVPPPPASTSSAAPAQPVVQASSDSSSSSSSQGQFMGDMTYYDVTVGTSSCGLSNGDNSQPLVAVAAPNMANGANPNANPNCGKMINIYYNGKVTQGKVYDTCPECASGSIDVTQALFKAVAPNGDGRVHGVSWSWA